MSQNKKFQCTRCSKNYIYKGGLTGPIIRKHPLRTDPRTSGVAKKNNKGNKPANKLPVPPKTVDNLISMNTQEMENLLEEEQEYYKAVEELEHDIGINDSMVNWFDVNFQSSFSNTGEFAYRATTVILPKNRDYCKESAKTFEKQRELLHKQDTQIQESYKMQKSSNDKIKKL